MLANGHPDARFYPLGLVWDEAQLVAERLNEQEATRAILLQMAVSSLFSKDAGKEFGKTVKRLVEG